MNRLTVVCATITCIFSQTVLGLSLPRPLLTPLASPTLTELQVSRTSEVPVLSNVQVLSRDPLVYVIPDFLSADECQAYMKRIEYLESKNRTMTRSNPPEVSLDANKLWPLPFLSLLAGIPTLLHLDLSTTNFEELQSALWPSISIALGLSVVLAVVAVPLLRILSDSSSRTSDAMALHEEDDIDFVRPLVDRVSRVTDHAWSKWEAPVVTRYAPGAIFSQHGDASPSKGSEWQGVGGQRVVTCIVYLNTLSEGGGETAFGRLGIKVEPRQGNALFFFPANDQSLEADDRTIHESLPPVEEKWIVQMFGRVGPRVPSPLGLPDSYGATI